MDEPEYMENLWLLSDVALTRIQPNIKETIDFKGLDQNAKGGKLKRPKTYHGFFEDTSDELSKQFSYKCTFSPTMCSKVARSYGSDSEALREIKQHIAEHFSALPPCPEICNDSSERLCSVKPAKDFPQRGSNSGLSTSREPARKEEILKSGQFEHDYARRSDKRYIPMSDAEFKKMRRGKISAALKKQTLNLLDRYLKGQSYKMPPHISTAPFPFVHHPESLEPAAAVEFYPNGDPVDGVEPAIVNDLDHNFSVSNKSFANRIKSKFVRAANPINRSVLECVENRVACKVNASSEQRDTVLPQKGVENSENIEEIARRNIELLTKQKKKRKGRSKPSVYACEICNKHFTANTSLQNHYMGHLNIKPFKCEVCDKTFTRRHSLKYHQMIHDNTTRFQCTECPKQFRHPSHYKDHLKKHAGVEPYSCKFCLNNFKTRNSFKRHLKMQHRQLLTSNGIVPIPEDN